MCGLIASSDGTRASSANWPSSKNRIASASCAVQKIGLTRNNPADQVVSRHLCRRGHARHGRGHRQSLRVPNALCGKRVCAADFESLPQTTLATSPTRNLARLPNDVSPIAFLILVSVLPRLRHRWDSAALPVDTRWHARCRPRMVGPALSPLVVPLERCRQSPI